MVLFLIKYNVIGIVSWLGVDNIFYILFEINSILLF